MIYGNSTLLTLKQLQRSIEAKRRAQNETDKHRVERRLALLKLERERGQTK